MYRCTQFRYCKIAFKSRSSNPSIKYYKPDEKDELSRNALPGDSNDAEADNDGPAKASRRSTEAGRRLGEAGRRPDEAGRRLGEAGRRPGEAGRIPGAIRRSEEVLRGSRLGKADSPAAAAGSRRSLSALYLSSPDAEAADEAVRTGRSPVEAAGMGKRPAVAKELGWRPVEARGVGRRPDESEGMGRRPGEVA